MKMIQDAVSMFSGPTQQSAVVIAVVAFVLGMVAMCVLCKLICPCGKGKKCAKPAATPSPSGAKVGEKKPVEKHHEPPADGSIEIYVGNLSYEFTEEQLMKTFSAYGKVNSARIITNKFNGKSKGFGFVHMPNRAEADAAVKAIDGQEIDGRKIRCNEARN